MLTGTHSFGQEPSVSSYARALDEADRRIRREGRELVRSNPPLSGHFLGGNQGPWGIEGHGDLEGWSYRQDDTLALLDECAAWLIAPDGATVGYVSEECDGTWHARHDRFNRNPRGSGGDAGWVPFRHEAEAWAYIVLKDADHLARYGS